MAVTSDAMYNTKTAGPSFMLSNMFYGYVPHCKNENQLNTVFEHAEIPKPPVLDCCSYDAAMETEDDGCDYSTASHYFNNDSVFLEASLQNRLQGNDRLQQCQRQAGEETDGHRRRNRKRCNSDISFTSRTKKFREETVCKDHVHSGIGSRTDHGSATVSYESEARHVDTVKNNLEQSMITSRNCCWSADEHILLNKSDCKHLVSNSGRKLIDDNIEYENILFETHGCSIYQFHRSQLVGNDCSEAEF